ncbi:MAG TPA: DUF192 domain-containing protein [Vicinamibacterales bacterium]
MGRYFRGVIGPVAAGMLLIASTAGAQYATARRAEATFPDGTRISLEVAQTEEERQRGLMHRTSLPQDAGMIFIFERPGLYPFWMKNTLIPLDLLWTDPSGRITWIAEHLPPCKADPCPQYAPQAEATYVIEVNAGFVKKHGVKVGQTVKLSGLGGD